MSTYIIKLILRNSSKSLSSFLSFVLLISGIFVLRFALGFGLILFIIFSFGLGELMLFHFLFILLCISLEVVGWHVGGPDLRLGSPRLLKVRFRWCLLLGLDFSYFLLDYDFGLALLDLLGGLLVDLCCIGSSLLNLKSLLGSGSVILDSLGLLCLFSFSFIFSINFLWSLFGFGIDLLLKFLDSLLLWELLKSLLLGLGSSSLLSVLSFFGLGSLISSLNSSLSGSLSSSKFSFSFVSGLGLLDNVLISSDFISHSLINDIFFSHFFLSSFFLSILGSFSCWLTGCLTSSFVD